MPLNKDLIRQAVKKMKNGTEVEKILIMEKGSDYVIISGFNTYESPIIIDEKINCPDGISDEIFEGQSIIF